MLFCPYGIAWSYFITSAFSKHERDIVSTTGIEASLKDLQCSQIGISFKCLYGILQFDAETFFIYFHLCIALVLGTEF